MIILTVWTNEFPDKLEKKLKIDKIYKYILKVIN